MKVGLMRLFTSCTKQVCDSKKSAPRLKHTRDFLASSPNRATELLLNRHAGYFDPSHLHADQYLIYKPRSGPPALFDVSGVELNFFSGIRHHNAQQQATTPNLAVHSRGICLLARWIRFTWTPSKSEFACDNVNRNVDTMSRGKPTTSQGHQERTVVVPSVDGFQERMPIKTHAPHDGRKLRQSLHKWRKRLLAIRKQMKKAIKVPFRVQNKRHIWNKTVSVALTQRYLPTTQWSHEDKNTKEQHHKDKTAEEKQSILPEYFAHSYFVCYSPHASYFHH